MDTKVPEIWFKGQRTLRSIVAALVVLLPIANGVVAAVIDYLSTQAHVVVDPVVFIWLNAILAGTALVIGLVARIMAVPGVNDLLTKIGLGSIPKGAITVGAGSVEVKPDPKVSE